jgi:hypothetical protein
MAGLKHISKSRFLATLQCPLMGWGLRRELVHSIAPDDHFSRFIADQGHIVGDYATEAWDIYLEENGHDPTTASVNIDQELKENDVSRSDPEEWLRMSVELTREAMNDPRVLAIYEATVHINYNDGRGGYTTRADILHRNSPQLPWHIIEVKSIVSNNFRSTKDDERDSRHKYIDDMAYTYMVFNRAKIPIVGISLLNINKGCEEPFCLEITLNDPSPCAFFNRSGEFTEQVRQLAQDFDKQWDYVLDITGGDQPETHFSLLCKKCKMCRKYLGDENFVFLLPNANSIGPLRNKLEYLISQGVYCVEDIPPYFLSMTKFDRQGRISESSYEQRAAIVAECIKQNKTFVRQVTYKTPQGVVADPHNLSNFLRASPWPALYLDFEFLMTAVPLWHKEVDEDGHLLAPGARPYQSIPVQYSLQACTPDLKDSQDGLYFPVLVESEGRSFVSRPEEDARRQLARQLANDVKELVPRCGGRLTEGGFSVFVWYQSAELQCLDYFLGKDGAPFPGLSGETLEILSLIRHNVVDLYAMMKGGKVFAGRPDAAPAKTNYYHPSFNFSYSLKNVVNMLPEGSPYRGRLIKSGAEAFAAYGKLRRS